MKFKDLLNSSTHLSWPKASMIAVGLAAGIFGGLAGLRVGIPLVIEKMLTVHPEDNPNWPQNFDIKWYTPEKYYTKKEWFSLNARNNSFNPSLLTKNRSGLTPYVTAEIKRELEEIDPNVNLTFTRVFKPNDANLFLYAADIDWRKLYAAAFCNHLGAKPDKKGKLVNSITFSRDVLWGPRSRRIETIKHEIGHVLGMSHRSSEKSIMCVPSNSRLMRDFYSRSPDFSDSDIEWQHHCYPQEKKKEKPSSQANVTAQIQASGISR